MVVGREGRHALWFGHELLPQAEEFRIIRLWFVSEGKNLMMTVLY